MRRALRVTYALVALSVAGLVALDRWIETAPLPPLAAPMSRLVTDRNGEPLHVYLAEDGRWRLPVALSRTDPAYRAMLIAFEDKRFQSHPGVDPLALLRAAGQTLWHRRVVSGGSTLTMQVARLLQGGGTGRWQTKLSQIRLALKLERRLSKDEILEIYLTRAPFGGNIEGVRAASFAWFGKDARRLSAAEAALLVALPQAPEARRPDRAAERARAARDRVLARAERDEVIDTAILARAQRAPVPQARLPMPRHAWHLAARTDSGAPVARLPVRAGPQRALEALAFRRAERLGRGQSLAVILADVATGEVIAQVGAAHPGEAEGAGHLDMTRAVRSPGSTLKPFIYALAFSDGHAHPETLINDGPTDFGGYAPQNFDGAFQGPVTARRALQTSLNVPAVALLAEVGPQRFQAALRAAGLELRMPRGGVPGLATALGGVGVTLEDLVAAFGVLARGGQGVEGRRYFDPAAAWYVTDILRGAPAPASAAGGAVAFKTGTSYGHRDAWAVGYDGRHVVGVWVGRPDGGSSPGLTGQNTAAPLLFDVLALMGSRPVAFPPPPRDALTVSTSALPPPLRRLGGETETGLDMIYPPSGARLLLPETEGRLVAKIRRGMPPFAWLVDGRPIATGAHDREISIPAGGPGFVTITVLDATGAAARRRVQVVHNVER